MKGFWSEGNKVLTPPRCRCSWWCWRTWRGQWIQVQQWTGENEVVTFHFNVKQTTCSLCVCDHFHQASCCHWQHCNDSSTSELLKKHGNGNIILEIRADSCLEGKAASENNVSKEHHSHRHNAEVLQTHTLQPAPKQPGRRHRPQQHQQQEEAARWERHLKTWLGSKLERRCLWESPGRKSKQKKQYFNTASHFKSQ